MTAYLLVDTRISHPEVYEAYKVRAKPIAEKHGGEYLARGGAIDLVEDDLWTPTRLVIIRFPDMAAARAFVDDPEYVPVRKIRQSAAAATIAIVDGI